MTNKILIKVTVDEALFPELYQRLNVIENPRVRAAVIRSLAWDALRVIASQEGMEHRYVHPSEASSKAQPKHNELQALDKPFRTVSRPADATRHSTVEDPLATLSKRFNVDDIADQFSMF